MSDLIDAALSIPDRESGWLLPALSKGLLRHLLAVRPDVIYSSGPPWTGHLVAAGLERALGRRWVADFRDPWSRAPWRGDRYGFAMRAAARLERLVVRCADRVVFVTRANRDDFAECYGPSMAAKFEVVPNGCDPAEFDALRNEVVPLEGGFVLLHAGSLYAGRTPMPLLRAVALAVGRGAIRRDQFRLRFLGANALNGVDLANACRQLGITDMVEFQPRVAREQSLRAMMAASALLLLQPGHGISVPGKLDQYIAAGRPILAIAEGETAELVRRTGIGTCVTGDDDEAIAVALIAVVNAPGVPIGPPPRELYDGNIGAAQMSDILQREGRPHEDIASRRKVASRS